MVAGQTSSLEVVGSVLGNVRFGSKADIGLLLIDVRFTPKSGHQRPVTERPLSANKQHRIAANIAKLPELLRKP
jgi:hypothetical protein